MTREEAINKIEEAVKQIKYAMPRLGKETEEALTFIVPELAESEEERIRKRIRLCLDECVHSDIIRDYERDEVLAYLEKQKAQKEEDEHLLSAIQVQFASHAKVENGKRYAKLTWDEFKKIDFELCGRGKPKPAEQTEVDLEQEVISYFQGMWPGIDANTTMSFTPPAIMRLVKHFYELGKAANPKVMQEVSDNVDKLRAISTPAEENWFEIAEEWEKDDEVALHIIKKRMCYDPVPISDEDRRIVENWLKRKEGKK